MFRAVLAGVAATLALCGCDAETSAPKANATSEAGPRNPPGIVVSDARIQLPAVSGRPGAAYFTVTQANGAPRSIAGVSVAMVGRTEIHETIMAGDHGTMKPLKDLALTPGKSVAFEPGGRHVMLFDLDPKLRFVNEVELTVTFDDGGKASTKAPVTTVNSMENKP